MKTIYQYKTLLYLCLENKIYIFITRNKKLIMQQDVKDVKFDHLQSSFSVLLQKSFID
jgi:hypothetical protein